MCGLLSSPFDRPRSSFAITRFGSQRVASQRCPDQKVEWPWTGAGLSDLYTDWSRCWVSLRGRRSANRGAGPYQAAHPDDRLSTLFTTEATTSSRRAMAGPRRRTAGPSTEGFQEGRLAAALQNRIADLALELLKRVQKAVPSAHLCLGGGLFYHSSINTRHPRIGSVRARSSFPSIRETRGWRSARPSRGRARTPPMCRRSSGPRTTRTRESRRRSTTASCATTWNRTRTQRPRLPSQRLQQGRLVGWFDGAMEWGPRALGARCNPGESVLAVRAREPEPVPEAARAVARVRAERARPAVARAFRGPAGAPFMECDYRPRRPRAVPRTCFRRQTAALRVQTVGPIRRRASGGCSKRSARATGLPFLVNTSFNGFHEPIVCSPRDAVRVFYGSGLDLLVLEQFVLKK